MKCRWFERQQLTSRQVHGEGQRDLGWFVVDIVRFAQDSGSLSHLRACLNTVGWLYRARAKLRSDHLLASIRAHRHTPHTHALTPAHRPTRPIAE